MWVLFCLVFLSISLVGVAGITCQQPDTCKCETDEGTVDLGPVSAAGTPPVFNTIYGNADGNYYDYDPCNTFTTGSGDCNGVLVCQQTQNGDYWGIGDSTGFTWGNDPDNGGALMISYTHYGSDGVTRNSEVTLICDESSSYDDLEAMGETGTATALYKFTLTSQHACPSGGVGPTPSSGPPSGGPPPPTGPSSGGGGLSIGSILCIVVLALLIVYVIAGMVFMRVGRGAQGAEMVPNSGFWKELPSLVADGCKFGFGGIKRAATGKSSTYDEI